MTGWTTVRIASLVELHTPQVTAPSPSLAPATTVMAASTQAAPEYPLFAKVTHRTHHFMPQKRLRTGFATLVRTPHRAAKTQPASSPPTGSTVEKEKVAAIAVWTKAVATPRALAPPVATQPTSPTSPSRFSIYAYSYWRWPSATLTLAAAGQYGGSQSGLIADYKIWDVARFDLQFRAAIAPQQKHDREIALGLRWQPVTAAPLMLIAERRFRDHAPDRFAITLAANPSPTKLPAGFRLESYGQAGWVSGPDSSWFFDASAHITKPVLHIKSTAVALGVGTWTGGQRGAQRIDAGPRLDFSLASGKLPLRLSADWRFRLAGDAAPGNGPALTLSSSF